MEISIKDKRKEEQAMIKDMNNNKDKTKTVTKWVTQVEKQPQTYHLCLTALKATTQTQHTTSK